VSIFAIADIHASHTDPATGRPIKPMDVFGPQWSNHIERLGQAWMRMVDDDDTVIVAGDTDWASDLDEAMETIRRLDALPGQKLLLRGNHDYWWSSKTTARVRRALPPSIGLIHNDAHQADGFNVCGAKGSPVPGGIDWTPENAKLLNREVLRLAMSLDSRDPGLPVLVALHYPPFYPSYGDSPYRKMLVEYDVASCVYGHLHGDAAGAGPSGGYDGVRYRLVAADAVDFRPILIARDGVVIEEAA
jgi:predicted phosphohydrolase